MKTEKTIEIYCENNHAKKIYPLGITLDEIKEDLNIKLPNQILGAIVNNRIKELSYNVVKSKRISFIDYSNEEGRRLYIHSLMFLLYVAVRDVFPRSGLKIVAGISNGYYCVIKGKRRKLTDEDIESIKKRMDSLVKKDVPFEKKGLLTEEALKILKKQGLSSGARLINQRGQLYSYLYCLEGYVNYFFGHHVPSCGFLTNFGLSPYFDGFLLQLPERDNFKELYQVKKEEKLFNIFKEHKRRLEILGISNVSKLNKAILDKRGGGIIKVAEALHEKKIINIANEIEKRRDKVKLILIAGPSSSGKTTFSKRLAVQLAVNGFVPHTISMDNYFVDRRNSPMDSKGNLDFESLRAVDVEFFNKQLNQLFSGETVELPKYNFITGQRELSGKKLRLDTNHILVVEGIHGMNPELLKKVDESMCYKIFISALTQISINNSNPISSTDNRLIRRIIRDNNYRGYSAKDTINRWSSVHEGEDRYIFPYQENADIMFNSSLVYELSVLKKYVEPLLKSVPENNEAYCQASRLLKFLEYFYYMNDDEIPPTSILREFLGGSSFT
ncbi:MAG: nucleoside kinase, partial [Prolixibacteraceae bacterium]|nr:nucleoside kinase [Prolixibacteraceae bacterium]